MPLGMSGMMLNDSALAADLTTLLDLSHHYGGDPAYVLAGGGNTSAKQGDRLWVKASGHALATIAADGMVELDRPPLDAMLDGEWPADPAARESLFLQRVMAARASPELGQRPSVEALLHHLLPGNFVVHTHPGVVNALTCCRRGEVLAAELFNHDVLWQPYVDPGLTLARAVRDALRKFQAEQAGRKPSAILLQNHGLIVGGDTSADIAAVSDRIVSTIQQRLDAAPLEPSSDDPHMENLLAVHAAAVARLQPTWSVLTTQTPATRWLAQTSAGRVAASGGALTPDQIVYCRSLPVMIEHPSPDPAVAEQQWADAWTAYERQTDFVPWVCVLAGAGTLAFRETAQLADVTRTVYADAAAVYRDANRLGGVEPLTLRDRSFIEGWEIEAHRRSVMNASAQRP